MIFCEIIFKIKKGKLKWEDGDIGKRRKWGDKGVRACKLFSAKGNGRVDLYISLLGCYMVPALHFGYYPHLTQ